MISAHDAAILIAQGEVLGSDDKSIGKVCRMYTDDESEVLTWVTVRTGLFGDNESFIPLERATLISNLITVVYDRAFIDHAPKHQLGSELSLAEETELRTYYGVRHDESGAPHTRSRNYVAPELPAADSPVRHAEISGPGEPS